MQATGSSIAEIFTRGGPLMWPLLALSLVSIALIIERAIFWLGLHRRGRDQWIADLADRLREGDDAGARAIVASDRSFYASVGSALLSTPAHDGLAVEMVERYRRHFERFGVTLSTIITAAPLLGILGTVTGIIQSFELLGQTRNIADIESIAVGIAQALITTAFGLVVALVALFPYMIFRAQADRVVGSIERLAAARLAARANGAVRS